MRTSLPSEPQRSELSQSPNSLDLSEGKHPSKTLPNSTPPRGGPKAVDKFNTHAETKESPAVFVLLQLLKSKYSIKQPLRNTGKPGLRLCCTFKNLYCWW